MRRQPGSLVPGINMQVNKRVIYCIFCGEELPSEARFCLRCGKRLPTFPVSEKASPFKKAPKQVSISEETARKLTQILKDYNDELYGESFSTLDRLKTAGLAKDPKDNQLLIDNPNAFLFGVIFDQQIKAERAWAAPRELYKRLGNSLNLEKIIRLGPKKLSKVLRYPLALHRFCNKLGNWLVEASKILLDKYGGKAENIWGGEGVRALEVIQRLDKFPGISQKKANMTASILVRDFKVPITGWEEIDIPYDIHIRRVFLRTGLIDKDTRFEVIAVGRKYSPDYPGKLDLPTWYVGRTWCHPRNPNCAACKLSSVCPKLTEKGRKIG